MSKINILIVEDSQSASYLLKNSLESLGYTVTDVCETGEASIEAAFTMEPDIILMDIYLAGHIDGIEAAEAIRQEKSIPVIFLTGAKDARVLNRVVANNPYGYVQKPYDMAILKTTIEMAMQRIDMEKQLRRSQDKLRLSTQVLELLNHSEEQQEVLGDILFIIQSMTDMDAVGIRVEKDGHFPYVECEGFDDEFIAEENDVRSIDSNGKNCDGGECSLDCLCGIVLKKQTQSNLPYFSTGGSFWSNDIKNDIKEFAQLNPDVVLRDNCQSYGFQSLALVPLHSKDSVVGILQLNSVHKDIFSIEDIVFYERISASIGITLSRNQTQEKLKEAFLYANELQKIVNRSPVVTFNWRIIANRPVSFVSDSIQNYGYFPEMFYEKRITYADVIHPDDRAAILDQSDRFVCSDEEEQLQEYRIVTRDGETRWVNDYSWKQINLESEECFIQGIILDVTEQVKANMAVKENETFLDAILKGIKAAIILVDPIEKKVVSVNDAALSLFQFTEAEALNSPCYDWLCFQEEEIDTEKCMNEVELLTHTEILIDRKDGFKVPVRKTSLNVMWKGKRHHVIILFDISEQKALERQLGVAQKLESIGSLAAGVAHEINTPIQYVGDNTHFLKQSFSDIFDLLNHFRDFLAEAEKHDELSTKIQIINDQIDSIGLDFLNEEIPTAIDQSIEGLERVASIVRAMKKFSHPDTEDKQPTDINIAIENTVTVARNEWKYVADVQLDLADDMPLVSCFPGDLNQVILNIIVNSAHAIGDKVQGTQDKGTIQITTVIVGQMVQIIISDTGGGIPEHIRGQIFDPFFTTKEVGKGTGQGLSIAHNIIVEKHLGNLTFDVVDGVGTTFTIELPVK